MGSQLLNLGGVWSNGLKQTLRVMLVLAVATVTVLLLATAGAVLPATPDWLYPELVVVTLFGLAWLIIITHTGHSRNGLETLLGHIRRGYRQRFAWCLNPRGRGHLRFFTNRPPTNRRRSRLARVHQRHYPAH